MEKSKERYVAEAMINEYLKMKKGECLAITADQDSNFPQLEAYLDVCHENEIACTILKTATPPGQSKAAEVTVPADATREFLMNVDCWIDAGSMGLLYGDIYEYVMENNKKMRYMLTINLPTDMLYEMYCSFHVDKMVELTNLMKKTYNSSKTMTVRSSDGMDITFEVDAANFVSMDNGDASVPGMYTPPADINFIPKQGTANGVIACRAVYAAAQEPDTLSEKPAFLHVKDGKVTLIDGDKTTADFLNKWYEKFEYDKNAKMIAHVLVGLLPESNEIKAYCVIDERIYGAACWGIGHVSSLDMPPEGQPSDTHVDVICPKITILFDDKLIMENGEFVHPEFKAIADAMRK